MPKPLVHTLKLLCTILLLWLVFKSVDVARVSRDLGEFPAGTLALLLAALWGGQLLCSQRWRILAGALGMRDGYFAFVQAYFAGMFFNLGLPSLVGGDAVKAYIISRKAGRPLPAGLASVLQDRVAGLVTLLLYGSVAVAWRPFNWKGIPLWTLYLCAWAGVAAVLGVIWKGKTVCRKLGERVRAPRVRKALGYLGDFHRALALQDIGKGDLGRVALYSFVNSALVLEIFRQVVLASGRPVDMVSFVALFPLVTLATMLPVTLNGMGVREWVYVEALHLVGIPRDSGLVISLATSALILVCNLGGAAFLWAVPKALAHPKT